MKVLPITAALVLMSGCLIRNEGESQDKTATNLSSFDACGKSLGNWNRGKIYKPGTKIAKLDKCKVIIGYRSKDFLRLFVKSNQTSFRKLLTNADAVGWRYVKKFMDFNRITCYYKGNNSLMFDFPVINKKGENIGHQAHEQLDIPCNSEGIGVEIAISVDSEDMQSLHFDAIMYNMDTAVYDRGILNTVQAATYSFIDTDSDGVIKRHVQLHDTERVILDNYKVQW